MKLTPKDYLSNIAGAAGAVGGFLSIFADRGLVSPGLGSWGSALVACSVLAIGYLTGKNPADILISERVKR
jgi:hypothetical protein